jgi:hypothetical protein
MDYNQIDPKKPTNDQKSDNELESIAKNYHKYDDDDYYFSEDFVTPRSKKGLIIFSIFIIGIGVYSLLFATVIMYVQKIRDTIVTIMMP